MDRTSIIVLAICLAILALWYTVVIPKLTPKPVPGALTNAPVATASQTNQTQPSNYQPATASSTTTSNSLAIVVNTNITEELMVVTNENARYTFTSHGGGLKLVELVKYPETVLSRREAKRQTNRVATLNTFTPAPTMALVGDEAVQGDGIFKLTSIPNGVRAEKMLTNGLSIIKEFQLSTNYLVQTKVRLENHAMQALKLPAQEWVVGTANPMSPRDNSAVEGVMWYNGIKVEEVSAAWFANRTLGCLPGTPRTEYVGGASNVIWAAVYNQFFALVAMPQQPALHVVARKIDLPRPTGEDARLVASNGPPRQGYEAAIVYPALALAPNQNLERQIFLYTGPKEYRTLARIADRFSNNLDAIMNFGIFGFVSKALLLAMNWLHDALKLSYGWAIVVITFIIKLVFWPLTAASTRSAKRMQALQPQMNAIREKYKDDPVKMNRKVMEFMKENKVSPLGGCLPMIIQIPVFFGFFTMIRSAIELRGARFLWVSDLSQPDTLFVIPGLSFIPFISTPEGLPINLLPLIMGATMLWQARLTPPSPGMDPAQAKLMRYMPLMFMVFLYNYSAALTLYWTVQNLLTIAQTKLTKTVGTSTTSTPPKATSTPPKAQVLTPHQKKRK